MRGLIRSAVLLAAAAAIAPAAAQVPQARYTNPILYADYSDPDVIRVGEDYYMVASSFHLSPGIPVLHSRDLVHWKIIGHVLPRLPFGPLYDMPGPHTLDDTISKPIGGTKYASGVWAPSIRHHDGRFWVYWATPDEGVFMATAADPAGPWSPVTHVIAAEGLEDPCPFWDEDGSAWLVHGRVGAGPLILHRMSPDGTRVLDEGRLIAEDRINLPVLEGPKFIKRGGWYYIFAPIGGVGTGPQVVGRAARITGPYEWRVVLEPGTTPIQGPHQGGYVETPSGQGWFAHFNSTGAFGRIVHLQPVTWQDGWPVMGNPIPNRTAGQPVASYPMPDTGSAPANDRLQDSDEFAGAALGLQWSWNHNPDDSAWSLGERPGWMRLKALPARYLVNARNTLTQVLQGPRSTITTRIDVSAMADGQRAGLTLFGVRPAWIGVVREGGVNRLTISSEGVETPGPVLKDKTVQLRAEVSEGQSVRYSFSIDGRRFTPLGDAFWLARFSWWKGSRPALFSFTRAAADAPRGWIDVDWFRVEVADF
ncbi:glycoside hydrolase 43 family protein [Sphingomonas canadensis]|uniref:Glycoside hydrolase 43 family protein n=1 Tax=Sphingomonas canadensis TaxID=1219257 RepID=A0ABW3HFC2_9SPHN|nr:glycoside hydrolase 43 family protein [Sphingomonas canadensis]MCW3837710.1 glycoside hydrolase 43 family protein [Sphingomonas canadensis]